MDRPASVRHRVAPIARPVAIAVDWSWSIARRFNGQKDRPAAATPPASNETSLCPFSCSSCRIVSLKCFDPDADISCNSVTLSWNSLVDVRIREKTIILFLFFATKSIPIFRSSFTSGRNWWSLDIAVKVGAYFSFSTSCTHERAQIWICKSNYNFRRWNIL